MSDKQAYVKLCLRKMVSKQVENYSFDIRDPEYNSEWSTTFSVSSSAYTPLAVSSELELKPRISPASQK